MRDPSHDQILGSPGHSAAWPGLLLGSLLILFVSALLYAAYLFLLWGRSTASELPSLPALPLPQLVRAAPAAQSAGGGTLNVPWQPALGRPAPTPSPTPNARVTVLVMGVDNRPDEPVARTDSIMLLTTNPDTGSIGMLSVARDLWVHVPILKQDAKINTVHVLGEINNFPGGGPVLLRDTLEDFLGYPIDYYVRINFDGFRQIIDQLGGIDINVPTAIDDPTYPDENYGFAPLYIPAGIQHMDGKLALQYARTRHEDSDYYRARRQQQIIIAIKDKLLQPGQLTTLLPRLPGLALALANFVQTDLPVDKAIALARILDRTRLQPPKQVVIDNTMGTESTDADRGFVLTPDMNKVHTAVASIFADGPVPPSAEDVTRQAVKDEAARVVVLNGSRSEGIGASTAAALATAGYNIVAVGNAENPDYAQTWLITRGDTSPVTREALVRRFAITPDHVRSDPPAADSDLTLIVGADQVTPPSVP